MNTSELVTAYKNELAENKPLPNFSLGAFFFNSFYFLYYNCTGSFWLFIFLPLIIMMMILPFSHPLVGYLGGMAVSRLIAAFVAPEIVRRHKSRYVEKFAAAQSDAPVEFFSLSLPRLAVLMILSGGLYGIYWAYKNWSAIKRDTKDDVWPILWSWFLWIFFIIPLFERIRQNMKRVGMSGRFMAYGYFLIIAELLQIILLNDMWEQILPETYIVMYLLGGLLYLGCVALLVLAQKQINAYNLKNNPQFTLRKNILPGEVIVTVVGFLAVVLSFVPADTPPSNLSSGEASWLERLSEDEREAVGFMFGSYHYHTILFNEYCTSQGYPLQNYERAYINAYEPQFSIMRRRLAEVGTSFNQAAADVYPLLLSNKAQMMNDVIREMEDTRQVLGGQVSMKEICKMLDERAVEIFNADQMLKNALEDKAAILSNH